LIEFGRHATDRRARAGLGKPETFKFLDSILRNVKQDDSNNEVDSTPTMKSLRQAAASNSTIFWIALSAR
jgi:hypothetical protein